MKPFRERNTTTVGVVAAIVVAVALLTALNFSRLPFERTSTYYADLANADQLVKGEYVTISGVKVGTVVGLKLEGAKVRLTMHLNRGLHLGDHTSLAVKVLSPLGQEYAQLSPSGGGSMPPGATIPLARTTVSPGIVATVTHLGEETGQINSAQLAQALTVATQDSSATDPAALASALSGLSRLSSYVASRQDQLQSLLTSASSVVTTLNAHSGNIVTLIGQSTLVLQVVEARKTDIDNLLASVQTLSHEISTVLTNPDANLSALLANLQAVAGVLSKDSSTLASSIPVLRSFATYVTNATGSGPYLDAIAPTVLVPDNLIVQCGKPGADTDSNPLTGPGCNAP